MAGKKKNLKFSHNLYEVLGQTLLSGVESGKLDPNKLDKLTANLGIDLGGGYGVNLGYNQWMGDIKQDLKIDITKKF